MSHKSALLGGLAFAVSSLIPGTVQASASATPIVWPACASESDIECVESLSVTTAAGTTSIVDPGFRSGGAGIDPYVKAIKNITTYAGGEISMVNFSVENPLDPVLGPGVYQGLSDATYSFKLRLGSIDPSFTRLAADPVSIAPAKNADGSFSITVTAKPMPFITVQMGSFAGCVSGGWACQGEVGVQRNVSGFVTSHPTTSMRHAVRGWWVATNASSFSSPQIQLTDGKITAAAAGPHTVPDGFPADGLVMEDGKALNPAFYKTYTPFTMLQAMVDKAPEDIRSYITPETVSAKITQLGEERDQPVTITTTDDGAIIDLGITHFSAPNPQIKFRKPAPVAAPSTGSINAPTASTPAPAPKAPKVKAGKSFAASSFTKVPSGYKVVSAKVNASSKKVCAASGKTIAAKKPGKCSYSVTVAKGAARKTVSGSVTVS